MAGLAPAIRVFVPTVHGVSSDATVGPWVDGSCVGVAGPGVGI